MPYLDLSDPESFVHVLQLYYAAHPQAQAAHEAVRARAQAPTAHFLSAAVCRSMAQWARQRQLITRGAAACLIATADRLEQAFRRQQGEDA